MVNVCCKRTTSLKDRSISRHLNRLNFFCSKHNLSLAAKIWYAHLLTNLHCCGSIIYFGPLILQATAVFAADAMARMTQSVGVAAVTAGPGLTNTITAAKNAQMAESPVIIIGKYQH